MVLPCANTFAHSGMPYLVCSACHEAAAAHINQTMPNLEMGHWWPLCKTCGDARLCSSHNRVAIYSGAARGCSCQTQWLCFHCQLHERYVAKMKSEQVALAMRQPIGMASVDGTSAVLIMGWRSVCREEILQDANVLRCSGCEGLVFGAWTFEDAKDKAAKLSRRMCAWS